jgi:hypothetical protein
VSLERTCSDVPVPAPDAVGADPAARAGVVSGAGVVVASRGLVAVAVAGAGVDPDPLDGADGAGGLGGAAPFVGTVVGVRVRDDADPGSADCGARRVDDFPAEPASVAPPAPDPPGAVEPPDGGVGVDGGAPEAPPPPAAAGAACGAPSTADGQHRAAAASTAAQRARACRRTVGMDICVS